MVSTIKSPIKSHLRFCHKYCYSLFPNTISVTHFSGTIMVSSHLFEKVNRVKSFIRPVDKYLVQQSSLITKILSNKCNFFLKSNHFSLINI